eukprot:Protomagalhaensia_sp_Gyna_25__1775@NODE_1934_length_1407_cov_2_535819_g1593_i0_p1_GENE_NODE_1934_length_1407_cov_2_535819_g1593_i0NODE_1934_length_1407_cov_2_535819_g1593_i0_p1_ORF_typecomplete_len296_score43_65_NODE_1934_length_1407_cov_2_535819_g1593_i03741261
MQSPAEPQKTNHQNQTSTTQKNPLHLGVTRARSVPPTPNPSPIVPTKRPTHLLHEAPVDDIIKPPKAIPIQRSPIQLSTTTSSSSHGLTARGGGLRDKNEGMFKPPPVGRKAQHEVDSTVVRRQRPATRRGGGLALATPPSLASLPLGQVADDGGQFQVSDGELTTTFGGSSSVIAIDSSSIEGDGAATAMDYFALLINHKRPQKEKQVFNSLGKIRQFRLNDKYTQTNVTRSFYLGLQLTRYRPHQDSSHSAAMPTRCQRNGFHQMRRTGFQVPGSINASNRPFKLPNNRFKAI